MPDCVAHGSLAPAITAILTGGLRVCASEPSFTRNVALAACRYAHPGRNSRHVYSGQALAEARRLAASGIIPWDTNDERQLEHARGYWDTCDNSGQVLLISTLRWVPVPSLMSKIAFDRVHRTVSGGITKWIEGHLCLQRRGRADANDSVIAVGDVVARIPATPKVRHALANFADAYTNPNADPPDAARLLTTLGDHWHPLASGWDFERIGRRIVDDMAEAVIANALRRLALSRLRGEGWRIVKTDHVVVHDEVEQVFWPREEVMPRTARLRSIMERRV